MKYSWALLTLAIPAYSQDGAQVQSGSAQITQPKSDITVVQQFTDKAIIDWKSFSIPAGQTVQFVQPSSTSLALNRVVGSEASIIQGSLLANGRIFLLNPNGILFGEGAFVDVNGFVASTLSLSNEDFLMGKYRLVQDPGMPLSFVVNRGTLHGENFVVLAAPLVDNSGSITSLHGSVNLLATGEATLQLDPWGLVSVSLGQAQGGTIAIRPDAVSDVVRSAVNTEGFVESGTIVEDGDTFRLVGAEGTAVQQGSIKSHEVRISASALGLVSGTIDASSRLQISAPKISVWDRSMLTGPEIRIGDWNSLATVVGPDASLVAGQGGQIWVIGGLVKFYGAAVAPGGFVETSGNNVFISGARVEAAEWLLDPYNVTISNLPTSNPPGYPGPGGTFDPVSDESNVNVADILATLNAGGSITIRTGAGGAQPGHITLQVPISKTSGGDATLALIAAGDINIQAGISSTSDELNVIFQAGGNVNVNADLRLNRGDLTVRTGPGALFTLAANQSVAAGTFLDVRGEDVSILGSMTADNIYLGAIGVNMTLGGTVPGTFSLDAGELGRIAGDVTLNTPGQLTFAGTLTAPISTFQADSIVFNAPFTSTRGINFTTQSGILVNSAVSGDNISLTAQAVGGAITVTAAGSLQATGSRINLGANTIQINGPVTAVGEVVVASSAWNVTLGSEVAGTMSLDPNEIGLVNARVLEIQSPGTITVSNPINFMLPANISSKGDLNINAAVTSNAYQIWTATNGNLIVNAPIQINGAGLSMDVRTTGNILVNADIMVDGGAFTASSYQSTGTISIAAGSDIQTNGTDLNLVTDGEITLAGTLSSGTGKVELRYAGSNGLVTVGGADPALRGPSDNDLSRITAGTFSVRTSTADVRVIDSPQLTRFNNLSFWSEGILFFDADLTARVYAALSLGAADDIRVTGRANAWIVYLIFGGSVKDITLGGEDLSLPGLTGPELGRLGAEVLVAINLIGNLVADVETLVRFPYVILGASMEVWGDPELREKKNIKIAEGRALWDLYEMLISIPNAPEDFYIPFSKPKNPEPPK